MEYGVVLRWWLFYQVLLVAGVPVTARLLPNAPDRGAALAIPVSLAALGVGTLWVGQFAFGQAVVAGVLVAYLALAAWLARGGVEIDARRLAEVVAVFTVAFAFLVAVRAAADGIYPGGGEKFLDFGLLQSLLRADRLPPQDMWFAGERVVYYYGGHLLAAVGAHLTGTEGRFAYSPALAGFFAMAVTGAYGLAGTIAAQTSAGDDRVRASTALGVAGVVLAAALVAFGVPWPVAALPAAFVVAAVTRSRRVRAGVLAAFAFGFAANLVTPVRLLAGKAPVVRDAVAAAGIKDTRTPATTVEAFSYWDASRVVEVGINEFPLFAYLNGDLHAHMMSVAVLFVVVGLGLAYYRTPAARRWRRRALVFGVTPLAAGLILSVNTWSFPTALGVTALAVLLADAPPHTLLPAAADSWFERERPVFGELQRVVFAVAAAGVVGALSLVAVWPFVYNVLLVGASNQSPAALPEPSELGTFLLVHGLFLAALGTYLVSRVADELRDWLAAALAAVGLVGLGASFDLAVAGVTLDTLGLLVAGPLVAGGWLLRRREHVGFEGVLVVAGAGLVVLVEYVYLSDAASYERFNTLFKVYAQVWALWTVPAGVALAALASRSPDASRLRSVAGTTLVAVLVVSASVYGGLALGNHFGGMDDATIDGMEYVHDTRPGEATAVEWLLDRSGQPHITSAPGDDAYSWASPASSLTGVPTVLGWVHEANYRSQEAYDTRSRDLQILYETEGARSRAVLLRKHDVRYVWVGPNERERYDVAAMADEPGIELAIATSSVRVYAVNQTELTAAKN